MSTLATRFGNRRVEHYAQTGLALTDDEIMRHAPSIFASSAHESRSQRYAYIPTSTVLRGLRNNGFVPFFVAQSKTRDASRREHTKHMIRLRHVDDIARSCRESVNEIIGINSHDGTTVFQLLGGRFRFACANGLVHGDKTLDVRVKHSGNVTEEVVAGAYAVLRSFESIDRDVDAFQHLQLTAGEQKVFAESALALRFGTERLPPITADQALASRRYADDNASLWATFNRVQENLVNGGQRVQGAQTRRRTRAVQAIDGNVALNRALWVLAERMRELKVAA